MLAEHKVPAWITCISFGYPYWVDVKPLFQSRCVLDAFVTICKVQRITVGSE